MPRPSAHKLAVLQRRKKVSELHVQGWSQCSIAEHLAVRQSTICEDLRHISKAWRESSIRDFDAARDLEIQKLNRIEREAWDAWERSKQPAKMATVDGPNGSSKTKRTVRDQYGDPRFLEVIEHCVAARRELLGLDAPTKIAPTTPDGRPLTNEQRLTLINSILIERFGAEEVFKNGEKKDVLEHDTAASADALGADDRRGTEQAQPDVGPSDPDEDTPSTTS
jgi:hypothetical protein